MIRPAESTTIAWKGLCYCGRSVERYRNTLTVLAAGFALGVTLLCGRRPGRELQRRHRGRWHLVGDRSLPLLLRSARAQRPFEACNKVFQPAFTEVVKRVSTCDVGIIMDSVIRR